MDLWIKAVLSLEIATAAIYILAREQDRHRREAAMWLLAALIGYWLR